MFAEFLINIITEYNRRYYNPDGKFNLWAVIQDAGLPIFGSFANRHCGVTDQLFTSNDTQNVITNCS